MLFERNRRGWVTRQLQRGVRDTTRRMESLPTLDKIRWQRLHDSDGTYCVSGDRMVQFRLDCGRVVGEVRCWGSRWGLGGEKRY
jgi:hypothetical protein